MLFGCCRLLRAVTLPLRLYLKAVSLTVAPPPLSPLSSLRALLSVPPGRRVEHGCRPPITGCGRRALSSTCARLRRLRSPKAAGQAGRSPMSARRASIRAPQKKVAGAFTLPCLFSSMLTARLRGRPLKRNHRNSPLNSNTGEAWANSKYSALAPLFFFETSKYPDPRRIIGVY